MKLSGLIIETSPVHSTKSARPLSIVKFVFLCDNGQNLSDPPLLTPFVNGPSHPHLRTNLIRVIAGALSPSLTFVANTGAFVFVMVGNPY